MGRTRSERENAAKLVLPLMAWSAAQSPRFGGLSSRTRSVRAERAFPNSEANTFWPLSSSASQT